MTVITEQSPLREIPQQPTMQDVKAAFKTMIVANKFGLIEDMISEGHFGTGFLIFYDPMGLAADEIINCETPKGALGLEITGGGKPEFHVFVGIAVAECIPLAAEAVLAKLKNEL